MCNLRILWIKRKITKNREFSGKDFEEFKLVSQNARMSAAGERPKKNILRYRN